MWIRVGGLAALAVLIVTACGGSNGEESQAETAVATEVPASTDVTAPPTTAPPSTEAPSTAAATTTTTTTVAPTTTIDEAEAFARQVERDYREAERRFRVAQQDPENRRARSRALQRYSSGSADAIRSTLDDFRERRLRILAEPLVEPTITIEDGPEVISEKPTVVSIQVCLIDPWVLVETRGAPDGSDAIVDDSVYAYRNLMELTQVDDVWVVSGGTQLGEWTGVEQCPA